MKRLISFAGALILTIPALAQGTVNPVVSDFRTRTSLEADWKLAKGLHLEGGYELRTENSFGAIDRHQAELGISYKINKWLKTGASYTFIYHNRGDKGWTPRHRLSADVTLGFKSGDWRFSLKEQLRFTHKTESMNPCQEVRNPLMLKSRAKVQYKGFSRIEPYAFFEVRNIFNDPSCSATWSNTSLAYSNYSFGGYDDTYINRLRGALGLEWSVSRHSAIDIYAMLDYCYDKNLDVDKTHTYLKSLTWDQSLNTIVGVAYKFSF
ncbi:MAG: DUF2490 domain-containing protein [Bacteroidales bacterium]|nr:DUF2490 domain-containing protein [Bacteroidales bacterium]